MRNLKPAHTPDGRPLTHLTYVEVARLLRISDVCVRDTEQRALRKLRYVVECEAKAAGCTPLQWLRGDV